MVKLKTFPVVYLHFCPFDSQEGERKGERERDLLMYNEKDFYILFFISIFDNINLFFHLFQKNIINYKIILNNSESYIH